MTWSRLPATYWPVTLAGSARCSATRLSPLHWARGWCRRAGRWALCWRAIWASVREEGRFARDVADGGGGVGIVKAATGGRSSSSGYWSGRALRRAALMAYDDEPRRPRGVQQRVPQQYARPVPVESTRAAMVEAFVPLRARRRSLPLPPALRSAAVFATATTDDAKERCCHRPPDSTIGLLLACQKRPVVVTRRSGWRSSRTAARPSGLAKLPPHDLSKAAALAAEKGDVYRERARALRERPRGVPQLDGAHPRWQRAAHGQLTPLGSARHLLGDQPASELRKCVHPTRGNVVPWWLRRFFTTDDPKAAFSSSPSTRLTERVRRALRGNPRLSKRIGSHFRHPGT